MSNPVTYHGVHSPTGSFMLQFWLYIPHLFINNIIDKHRESGKENLNSIVFVHLVSRLPEASDVNQLSLFEKKDLNMTKCLPTVYLCIRPHDSTVYLNISASSGPIKKQKSGISVANALPPATAFVEIDSRNVQCDRWIKCAVHLKGDTSSDVSTSGNDVSGTIERERYELELSVNGEIHGTVSGLFRGYVFALLHDC